MPRRLVARLLLLCLAVLVAVPFPAHAAFWDAVNDFQKPNMKLGLLELHPYYQFSESYDSNIYLVPKDQPNGVVVGGGVRSSWIHDNNIGIKAKLPFSPANVLDLGYDFDYKAYSQAPGANNAISQKADAAYNYKGEAFKAGVSDNYINTVDPAFSELIQRERRWQNTAAANAEYGPQGGALSAGLDAFEKVDKYLNPSLAAVLNRYEQQFGPKFGYWIQPQTRVYTAYHYDVIHYTAGRAANSKAHLVDFGVEGNIAPKLTGQIQTGLQYRHYDFDPANPTVTSNTRNWQLASKLLYKPLERTTVNLEASRRIEESTFATNRFYIANNIGLGVEHKLPGKLTLGAGLSFGVDKYPETTTVAGDTRNRRDDLYTQEVHGKYDIQEWLYVGLSYMHRSRFSVFPGAFNYDDNVTTASLGIRL